MRLKIGRSTVSPVIISSGFNEPVKVEHVPVRQPAL
jgi:hypothetical protein